MIAANRQVNQMADRASDNVSLLELDVTSGSKVIASKVKEAWQIFGHIDVLVNNAGTFFMGPFEQVKYARSVFEIGCGWLTLLICVATTTKNAFSKPTCSEGFT